MSSMIQAWPMTDDCTFKQDQIGNHHIQPGGPPADQQPEAKIEPISAQDLRDFADCTKQSAAGLVQWAPADFAMRSDKALGLLADLLNRIEGGAPWYLGCAKACGEGVE